MKKITLVLSLFTAVFQLQAQDKLLSSIDQSNNNGSYENNYGYNYEYDANDNLITEIAYSWNSSTSSWDPDYRDSYLYNANGKATELVSQDYNSTTGNYENDYRDVYTYNSNGDILELISQEFINGSYQNEFRLTTSYLTNSSGTRLASFLEYEWNGSQWVLTDRGSLNYDSNNNIESIVSEVYNNGTYSLDYRDSFTYDSKNQLIRKIFEIWNGSSYDLDEEFDYTYDANGNLVTEVFDYQFETPGPIGKETYVYDSNVLMSSIANPFRDKTGLDYIFDDYPFVNKVLEQNYQSYDSNTMSYNGVSSKTVYNYNATLNVPEPVTPIASIKVYPNPTSDFIEIETSNFNFTHADVIGILGNRILSTDKAVVNLTSLPAGLYFLNIHDDNGSLSTHKIVKE